MATIALPEAVPSTTLGQVFLDGRVWCEGEFSIAGLLSTLGLPGRPLAPNGLNHGKAGVPEYHHVYMEERNLNVHVPTGALREGTVIVKGLTRFLDPAFSHGSRSEPSTRPFQRSIQRFGCNRGGRQEISSTNVWGFFHFGHHPEPHAEWRRKLLRACRVPRGLGR